MRCEVAACDVQVVRDQERAQESVDLRDEAYIKRAAERLPDIGRKACPPLVVLKHPRAYAASSFTDFLNKAMATAFLDKTERPWEVFCRIYECGSPGGWYTCVLPARLVT